ncbi:DUF1194 domain-containing protein [Candidatus Halocynthiibacter alkanivorans]|uniref:DUF1194 domain-containing protein n=1 Tax=Candidatus Halocynthiibacter alkanivorans TaxID=2267619 RepID=UPI003012DCE1
MRALSSFAAVLAVVGAAAMVPPQAVAAVAVCRQALALGLDVSGSVNTAEYRLQSRGLANALLDPEVSAAFLSMPHAPVRLFIYEWAEGAPRVLQDWREIRDAGDLAQTAALLRGNQRVRMPPATQLGMAMRFGARALAAQQSCWKLTLDISGDGKSNAGPRPRDVRNSGVLGRATVNGLLISSTGPGLENYYRAEVLHGPDAFVEKARGYSAYSDAMRRKLLRELKILAIGALDPAEVTPADLPVK